MTKTQKNKFEKRIKNDLIALIDGCGLMDQEKIVKAQILIDNIAFMAAELAMLREDIAKNGSVKLVTNGNNITSQNVNPSLRAYNTTMKTLCNAFASFNGLIPKEAAAGSALRKFLMGIEEETPEERERKDQEVKKRDDEILALQNALIKGEITETEFKKRHKKLIYGK